jgi:hypothetical protein
MARSGWAAVLVVATIVGSPRPASVRAADGPDFSGRWALNRELSQFPREVGFGTDWLPTAGSSQGSTAGGGRGRRSGGGGSGNGAFPARRESEDDARRLQQLTAEVRNPSAHLIIVETPAAVSITDDRGRSRTVHPNGKEEVLQLEGVPVGVTSRWEAGRLVVAYLVEQGRELRYTYSRVANPPQLVVEAQFLEHGGGDVVRRIYGPASATDTVVAATVAPPPATAKSASAERLPDQTFNQQPDAELKGLTKLGIVVEDLSAQATACGLKQPALESTLSKRLSDAGFSVLSNSDEDTYVYINVKTTSVSNGLCVSRYDAFLYTHTTAKLSYQQTPVLVQVSLLHNGGIAGGSPAAHAEAVTRGLQEYVDQFSKRIRDANK